MQQQQHPIDLDASNPALYSNRSAVYQQYPGSVDCLKRGLEDANKSISLDGSFAKGYVRASLCLMLLMRYREASTLLERALDISKQANNPHITLDIQKRLDDCKRLQTKVMIILIIILEYSILLKISKN